MSLQKILVDIQQALKTVNAPEEKGSIASFKKQKQEGAKRLLSGAIKRLLEHTKNDPDVFPIAKELSDSTPEHMLVLLDKLADFAAREEEVPRMLRPPSLPHDIKEEVNADIAELNACMSASCFRSAVILCGRLLETALHRKYFEATGQDLLEKAPGTGLGNLIAKLAQKGVKLDPGLSNQIHLINQVRIFSVHKKQDLFIPSKAQAEAIRLYTLDILSKLF